MIAEESTVRAPHRIERRISVSSSARGILKLAPKSNQLLRNPVIKSLMQPVQAEMPTTHYIFIKEDYRYTKVNTEDIYLVEALSDYIHFHTKERRYTVRSTMYGTLEKLPAAAFVRVHRSYIVRIDSIFAIEDNMLLIEDRFIPLGKKYKREVMSRLNIFV